ncbi:hypothetical protein XELAEV_18022963mg, partial [Xenopus laevis]
APLSEQIRFVTILEKRIYCQSFTKVLFTWLVYGSVNKHTLAIVKVQYLPFIKILINTISMAFSADHYCRCRAERKRQTFTTQKFPVQFI